MAALDFPATPTIDQLYPDPAVVDVPQYRWNGTAWMAATTPEEFTYVKRGGDTMAGDLKLFGNPPDPLSAVPKQYAVAKTGDVMAGHLTLPTNPAGDQAVRKDYVDTYGGQLNANKVAKAGDTMTGDLTLLRSGVPSTGALLFGNTGNRYLFYDGGTFNFVGGGLQVGSGAGTFSAGGGVFTNDVTITRGVSGAPGNAIINLGNSTNRYLFLDGATAMLYVVGCNFQVPQGYKPGGGDWIDSSDARIKNVTGDYTRGLADVTALRPVTYTFKGNDTPGAPSGARTTAPYLNSPHHQAAVDGTKYAGLVAQEVEAVMPEMVKRRSGTIDGIAVTDLRDLDTTPLIFALVNAVKDLHAEVEALKAAR